MDSRERILRRIRQRKKAADAIAPAPRWPDSDPAQFMAKVEQSGAQVQSLQTAGEIHPAVTAWLASRGLAKHYAVNHPQLEPLCDSAPATGEPPLASLALADAGIAETGSLVLNAGPGVSSADFFLAEQLIVVVEASALVSCQEAYWQRLRRAGLPLPRTVTLVTGPSRTGDIEQKLVIGAHGPVDMLVLVVEQPLPRGAQ